MPRYRTVSKLIKSVGNAWAAWRDRQASLTEMAACGPAEIGRIAADLRLTDAELRQLANRGPDSAKLLDQRLAADGIAPDSIEPAVMRDLQRCCSNCDSKSECAHDLKQTTQPAKWPSYCPNAETIEALSAARCH
jgi:hypothetical protein